MESTWRRHKGTKWPPLLAHAVAGGVKSDPYYNQYTTHQSEHLYIMKNTSFLLYQKVYDAYYATYLAVEIGSSGI
jgi:hypothetical protein